MTQSIRDRLLGRGPHKAAPGQAAQKEKPGDEVASTRAEIDSLAGVSAQRSYPAGGMQYKIPVYHNLYSNVVDRFIEGNAVQVMEQLGRMTELPPVPGDDAKFSKTKAQAELFAVGVLRGDLIPGESQTADTAFIGVQAVAFDVDSAIPAQHDELEAKIRERGWYCLITTSYKHRPETPRKRYLFPLSEQAVWGTYTSNLWGGVQSLSGGIGDTQAKNPGRRSYFPCCPVGEAATRPSAVILGHRAVTPEELAALAQPRSAEVVPDMPGMAKMLALVSKDIPDIAREDNRSRDLGLVVSGCSMVAEFAKTGDPDKGSGDTLWRHCAGICHYVRSGEEFFHEASSRDGRYDEKEAQKKFDGWGDMPPPRCTTIEGHGWAGCATCPNKGRISTPVQLGDSLDTPRPDQGQQATASLEVAEAEGALRTVVDQDGDVNYVTSYEREGRTCRNVYRSGSRDADDTIIHLCTKQGGKPPTDKFIEAYEARKRVEAKQTGEVTTVHLRVAKQSLDYFHDLGPGRVAKINAQGWSVIDEAGDAPLFRRGAGAGVLPDPVFSGDAPYALSYLIAHFQQMFGLTPKQAFITAVLLCDRLDPTTTHPVLSVVGAGGSGKSVFAEAAVNLIDPSDGKRRTVNARQEDVAAAAQQTYALMIDNAGRFDPGFSDVLCVVATGGSLMVRELYQQSQTRNLNLHRPVTITSVNPVCVAPDLMTRVVQFELSPRVGGYVSEDEIRERLDQARPTVLGALYTLFSAALGAMPAILARPRETWKHRLVSFDQLGEAVAAAAGLSEGAFLSCIGGIRERMARRTASGDGFVIKLLEVLGRLAGKPTDMEPPSLWALVQRTKPLAVVDAGDGQIEVLARPAALRGLMPPPDPFNRDHSMPGTDRAFLDALRRVQPMLAGLGVSYREVPSGTRPVARFGFKLEALQHV